MAETGTMTDAERARCLRGLRFPKELEAAFQQDYYQRIVPSLRVGLALMALIMIGQTVAWFLLTNAAANFSLVILRPLPLVATIGLTYWRGFWRYWQWYFVALLALGLPLGISQLGRGLSDTSFWSGPAAQLAYFGMMTLYGMVMLSGMLRLHFRWAALYQTMLVGWSLSTVIAYVRLRPENILMAYGAIILPALIMMLFASYAYERLQRSAFLSSYLLDVERSRSEAILRNTLPGAIVDRLKASDALIADDYVEVTVLFADIAGFTPWSAARSAQEVVAFLSLVFSRFDRLVESCGLEKIKTVGDCYMVIAGAPTPRADHVEATARLALAMQVEAQRLSVEQGAPIHFRIGIHAGPLVAGLIGEKRFLYDVWGDTVNIASRLETHGVPGAIQVSAAVAKRLQGRFLLRRRGEVEVKGKGLMETFFLESEAVVPVVEEEATAN